MTYGLCIRSFDGYHKKRRKVSAKCLKNKKNSQKFCKPLYLLSNICYNKLYVRWVIGSDLPKTERRSAPAGGALFDMAFCDLKPVRVYDDDTGITYYIGDVFAVYAFGAERPVVYSWDMIESVSVTRKEFVIKTAKRKYSFDRKRLKEQDYFRSVGIIEREHKAHEFAYEHEKRMFPLKSVYTDIIPGKDAYLGSGQVDEGDCVAAFVLMMNLRLIKVLWLVAVLIMLVTFGALHFFVGITRDNILYFIPISIASGGIVSLVVYLICHMIAKGKYRSIADADPASEAQISFVVCKLGFAACESCIYDGQDLIPWNAVDYFVETDKMFIFYKDNAAYTYIPKKAFEKKYISGISDIIAIMLEQK